MKNFHTSNIVEVFMQVFQNRAHAGQVLSELFVTRLHACDAHPKHPSLPQKPDVILALPRGGVPVALPISVALDAPLDVWVARKIGVPGHRELAMGAIAEGGGRFLHAGIMRALSTDASQFAEVEQKERIELERRVQKYRQRKLHLQNRFVCLIDDGMATGSTLVAGVRGVLAQKPARLWVGIPVATEQSLALLPRDIDEVICAHIPDDLWSVSAFYEDFRQVTDDEVVEILKAAKQVPFQGDFGQGTNGDSAAPQ